MIPKLQTWKIGDVRVRKLVELEFLFWGGEESSILPQASREALSGIPWLYPDFAAPDGELKGSIHAFLVETSTARIVVDAGVGNAKRRSIPYYNMLTTSFMKDFENTGWSRESVTYVINTHLHFDHVGWNTTLAEGRWIPTFPNAKYVMSRVAFEYHAAASDEDRNVIPEIQLRPSPGHAPGHVNVVIDSAGHRAVISGDVMHHPCQAAHPEWSSTLDFDQDLARVSRLAFLDEFADTPAIVLGTHFPDPAGGRIERSNASFVFNTRWQ